MVFPRRTSRPLLVLLAVVPLASSMLAGCSDPPDAWASERSPGCTTPDPAFWRDTPAQAWSEAPNAEYALTVPSSPPGTPVGLLVNLHGGLSSASHQDEQSRFPSMADEGGFAVLSPGNTRRAWGLDPNGPDVRYVEGLIEKALTSGCVDTRRVHLAGFSMGAMMSQVLACRAPAHFASIALVSGTIQVPGCEGGAAVPVLSINGAADEVIRPDGTVDPSLRLTVPTSPPRAEVVERWADANRCQRPPAVEETAPGVVRTRYTCADGDTTEMYVVRDQDHSWPGGPRLPGNPLPSDAGKLDASVVIRDYVAATDR